MAATKIENKTYLFDPSNWSSIRQMYDIIQEVGVCICGINDNGESVIYYANDTPSGKNVSTETFQKNGWIRTNVYWLDDYIVEELYKKE